MAFTYLILNSIFVFCVVFMLVKQFKRPSKNWWITLGVLLVLTFIFDSLIIWAGVVGYDATKILGLYIGLAPVEDFFYAFLAVIIVPVLWRQFGEKRKGYTQ